MSSGRVLIRCIFVAFIAFLFLIPFMLKNIYWLSVLITVWINVLLAMSLRIIAIVGHITLGHVGFMLLGAYSSALLVVNLGITFWITLVLAGVISACVALVLGYPFLRVKGIYFAILTLLTAETFRLTAYHWRSLTGGALGMLNIPPPGSIAIPGIVTMTFETEAGYYYLACVIVLLSLLSLYCIEHSRLGFKWRAIREAEGLAQSIGLNVLWHKMLNFAIGCFFAGVSGALFAHYQHGLSPRQPSQFGVMSSIYLLLYMVVGGERHFAGPIIGALVLTTAAELARPLQEYQPMMIGALAIIVVLILPEGIIKLPYRLRLLWRNFLE